jgi:hypothetical protein
MDAVGKHVKTGRGKRYSPSAGRRTRRRFRVPATALFLSFIMAMVGSVPHDAMAGIVALSLSSDASIVHPHPQRDVSTRYPIPGILLLLIILLVLWLVYRTYKGWKPMIS